MTVMTMTATDYDDPNEGSNARLVYSIEQNQVNENGELIFVIDPETGKATMLMRDPNLTPLEATDLKSNIYGMTNYDPTGSSTLSNNALKGSAHGLKTAVEKAVPESIPSGQRLHNLMAAKDTMAPYSASRGLDLSKSGLMKNAAMTGATSGAAVADLLGSGAQNVSPTISLIAPPTARLSPFANAHKKDENQ